MKTKTAALIGFVAIFAAALGLVAIGFAPVSANVIIPGVDPHIIPGVDPHIIPGVDPHIIPGADPH